MGIAISDDHLELSGVAEAFLANAGALAEARTLLDAPDETVPAAWKEMAELGWLGLHLPEAHGGSGCGLAGAGGGGGGAGRGGRARAVPAHGAGVGDDRRGGTSAAGRVAAGSRRRVGERRGRARRRARTPRARRRPRGRRAAARRRRRGGRDAAARWACGCRHTDATRRVATVTSTATPRGRPGAHRRRAPRRSARPHPGRRRGRRAAGRRASRWPSGTSRSASSSAARSARSRPSSTTAPTCWSTPSWPPRPRGTPRAPRRARPQPSWRRPSPRARRPPACGVRGDGHPAARRHRLHVGARLPPLPAPRRHARRVRSDLAGDAAADTARLVCDGVARTPDLDLPAGGRAVPRRGAGVRRAYLAGLDATARRARLVESGYSCRTGRRRGAAPRRRRRAARDRAGAARRGVQTPSLGIAGWNIQTITQHGNPEQAERWVRPTLAARSRGASCSPSPGPGRTPPAIAHQGRRSTAGGGSPGRRCGPPGRTSRTGASPPCAPTRQCPSTQASR